jgi:hypothetical protein
MVKFIFNDHYLFAYYNNDGDLLGLTRYISQDFLPLNMQNGIKKNYNDYWITDLFEVSKNGETYYYVTLENANTCFVLKGLAGAEWNVFKKVKKT